MRQKGSPDKDWSSDQVVAAIRERGISIQALSESFGLHKQALYRAIHTSSYPAHEERLARFLDLRPEEIWPERCAARLARAELKASAQQRAQEIQVAQGF
ncbi:helix-turn-helix domain-containing protein [Aeromonas dhakensis]|uniref:helix-turn-helix domain-containing protein n=1 Tax=Aeromonas dhakensis TaxID=196024 RepID=UPI00111B37E0|nr:DNA-binding protein [Aeromonas dhakensis]